MKVCGYVRLVALAVLMLGFAGLSYGQINVSFGGGEVGFGVGVSIGVPPPPLPVYEQPPIPAAGYVWTPGYWAWDDDDGYYWVPGTWVQPPEVGVVWTPGYWGWNDGMYGWNPGYWGTEVGFYGGIDYGYGYPGDGYYGGEWRGGRFYYNREVNNVTNITNITTVYSKPVPRRAEAEHVSYAGGQGGTQAKPTPQQEQARKTAKVRETPAQKQQVQAAKADPKTHAKNNGGKPAVAATPKPGDFSHAVQAKAAGGKVDQKSLQANAKTAKVQHKGGNEAGNKAANAGADNTKEKGKAAANTREANKPGENGGANARETGRTVPKPPNAGGESNTHARETQPNATRPGEKPGRESGNASGMPQSEGARHAAQPSDRSNTEPRNSEPAARHEATPNHGAAAKEAPDKNNDKSKPDKNDKPDKNEKPQ